MALIALILVAAAAVWWAAYARRGPLWVGAAAFIALGYMLGPPLWSPNVGTVPLTIDRLLLVGLAAAVAWHWRQRRLNWRAMTGFDWLLIVALGYFTIRCALTPAPPPDGSAVKPWWRLVVAFWIPAAIYLTARAAPPTERSWRAAMWIFAALGGYLAFTAFAEVGAQWWAVFPRYIGDPTLGTHFGRARGPALNSASLGIYLTTCFWAAWLLWPRLARPGQLAVAGLLVLIAGGVYFTYTRSTWIGLAASLAAIPLFQLPRPWRIALVFAGVVVGAAAVVTLGDRVTNLGRKDTDGSAEHSVYQRASLAIVSMRMWSDAPILGCGFGRFYDLKQPYLADRGQQIELESLRQLDHHNTLLSVLVETGIVGLAAFLALLMGWTRAAWRLARDARREPWQRAQGLFSLATIITYLSSALFHDLTLSATEHWPLFFAAGITVGLIADRRALVAARDSVRSSISYLPRSHGEHGEFARS